MIATYKDTFDSYLNAQRDYDCYLASKGYRIEGDYTVWEPQHEVEGEEEFYQGNDEPTLGFEEEEEPEMVAYTRYYSECACAEF